MNRKMRKLKKIAILFILLITSLSFSQNTKKTNFGFKPRFSETSEMKIVYKDSLNEPHFDRPIAYLIDGMLMENIASLDFMDSKKIKSMRIEKENLEIDGKKYFEKIIIETKEGYNPDFRTLKEISEKYLKLNNNPVIFQVDGDVVNESHGECLVDKNFILKITVEEIKSSEEGIVINLVKLTRRTSENIEEANIVRIR